MEQNILEIINTVLRNRGKKEMKKISPGDHLRDNIGFDSLDLAELTVRIEAEFGIDIFEDSLVNTIGEVYNKLKK